MHPLYRQKDGRPRPGDCGYRLQRHEVCHLLSQQAEADGADALLLVTPYYNKTSQAGLLAHYTAIADAVHIPCILYNVPSRTGCSLTPATLAELAKHPNINAVKEASGNISTCRDRSGLR